MRLFKLEYVEVSTRLSEHGVGLIDHAAARLGLSREQALVAAVVLLQPVVDQLEAGYEVVFRKDDHEVTLNLRELQYYLERARTASDKS